MAVKTSISFGLVYIPITLQNAVRKNQISFNMLHKKHLSRISYKKTCPQCGDKDVPQKDIVKGYQYQPDKYVIIEDEDLQKIKSKRDKTVNIEMFCDIDTIDPIYYEKSYYVHPQPGAERALSLLISVMESSGKVGISKTVLTNKDTLLCLRVRGGDLLLTTLHFAQEILKSKYTLAETKPDTREVELAKNIVDNMTGKFLPEKYNDEYSEKLQALIESKINGKEIVAGDTGIPGTGILNLMEALEKSLSQTKKQAKVSAQKSKSKAVKSAASKKRA